MLKSIPSTFTLERTDRKGGIGQSQALPVRLVPYATGDFFSTIGLVQMLAEPDSPLTAYVVPNDKFPPPMRYHQCTGRCLRKAFQKAIYLPI